eukprot:Skav227528  [mRNA]  locus=scaffold2269:205119:205469:- [translate_table: standard]
MGTVYAGVLLDGVGDAFFLKRHREALQGRAKVVKGGQSATNMYAYPYSLHARAVVATLDLSASNLEAFQSDHWLSSLGNVFVLRLEDPVFETEPSVQADAGRKRRWMGSPARQLFA